MTVEKTDEKNYFAELPMYITKATQDGRTMRWVAVNSDTQKDSYGERMSYQLYRNFEDKIKNGVPVPEIFRNEVCSDFWDGGMPYLSVSHYPDLNGDAVPGQPIELFVDGDEKDSRLKAKGILFDSPLGHSVFRSLKEDKVKNPENKIRISIGFLDLAHQHGENGNLFVRDSLLSTCQECKDGVEDKIYVDGYLVHLALTRVPVNKRTEMALEEKSMTTKAKVTRKGDAASIVGKDLAEEIDSKNKVERSDLLVEMSEAPVEETAVEPVVEPEVEAPVEKAETEKTPEVVEEKNLDAGYSLPYGGAVSMKEAKKAQEAKAEMFHVMDMFSMFQQVAWNIIDRGDVTDKKAAFSTAVDEFKSMLAAKAMVEFSVAAPVEEHALQPALDALLENIDNSSVMKGSMEDKLQAINPALQLLGTAITDFVRESESVEPTPAQDKDVAEILKNIIQPLTDSVNAVSERLGILESKSSAQSVEVKSRIPAPRSHVVPPELIQKSEETTKPGSLRDIINKSVGIP